MVAAYIVYLIISLIDDVIALIVLCSLFSRKLLPSSASEHPPIVHCSAGIGRTGTFIVCDGILHQVRLLLYLFLYYFLICVQVLSVKVLIHFLLVSKLIFFILCAYAPVSSLLVQSTNRQMSYSSVCFSLKRAQPQRSTWKTWLCSCVSSESDSSRRLRSSSEYPRTPALLAIHSTFDHITQYMHTYLKFSSD